VGIMAAPKIVKGVVLMLCENYQRKFNDSLLAVWVRALKNVPDSYIETGYDFYTQKGKSKGFMPSTDQFIDACRELQNKRKKEKRLRKEAEDPVNENRGNQIVEIDFDFNPNDVRVDLIDYLTPEGNIKYVVCYGHIDKEKFRQACSYQFRFIPSAIIHEYWGDGKEVRTKENGEVYRISDVVKKSSYGNLKVTVGYI
jgi:hypothetical protein